MEFRPNQPQPVRPTGSAPGAGGFSMVEFILAAFILGVGLLGLCAMQTATVRGQAGAAARLTAALLARNSLELVQTEAGHGAGPRVERFGPDGRPAEGRTAFFTVTVTRSALAVPGAPDAPGRAWAFRTTVVWTEGPSAVPASLGLTRLVAD